MILVYPKNFTSTQTYQNANYTFPHNDALSAPLEQLKRHFYNPQYILPDYLLYTGRQDLSIENLQSEEFTIMGISFIKLKNLEEKLDEFFNQALAWKMNHTNLKYQKLIDQYITVDYYHDLIVMVNNITTIVQLMIINDITYDDFQPDPRVIALLNQFNQLRMTELPVSITIYLAQVIPIIKDLADIPYNII